MNALPYDFRWRVRLLWIILLLLTWGIVGRLFYLCAINRGFLLKQSEARILRVIPIPAYRGMITDRLGVPLAISIPVQSIWINPKLFHPTLDQLADLSRLLHLSIESIGGKARITRHEFVYLKRAQPLAVTEAVKQLNIPGIFFQKEYKTLEYLAVIHFLFLLRLIQVELGNLFLYF